MKNETTEDIVIKYITAHEGVTVSDIFNGVTKKGCSVSLNALRRLLRKIYREKKVMRTGVHTFKYKLRK